MAKPTPPGNRTDRADSIIRWWAALSVVLLLAVGALLLALFAQYGATGAAQKAADTAKCVNAILGARAPLTAADHANERQKINGQIVAERDQAQGLKALIVAKTQAEGRAAFRLYQRGVDEFETALNDWKVRDDQIAAEKKRHPLGKC